MSLYPTIIPIDLFIRRSKVKWPRPIYNFQIPVITSPSAPTNQISKQYRFSKRYQVKNPSEIQKAVPQQHQSTIQLPPGEQSNMLPFGTESSDIGEEAGRFNRH
jgi:hypothetical protein